MTSLDESNLLIERLRKVDYNSVKWNYVSIDRNFQENFHFERWYIIPPEKVDYFLCWFRVKTEPTKLHKVFYL